MTKFIATLVLVVLVFEYARGHTYSFGSCPVIEPMTPFNMNRMLGLWYVIQKTSTASTCITYNFTRTDEPDHYELEQVSQHFFLGLTPLEHEYRYTGQLTVPDEAVPAKMLVKFPLNIIGKAAFTVFMTDYDEYAAIYTCQGLAIGHRDSATILSRHRTLDKVFTDKIRTRLASYNIDPFDLSIVSQKDCPKNVNGTSGLNINIDDDTFSAQSAAEVVRKAGETLGDGLEYIASGAKRVYSSYSNEGNANRDVEMVEGGVRQDHMDSKEKMTDATGRSLNVRYDDAAEWLP